MDSYLISYFFFQKFEIKVEYFSYVDATIFDPLYTIIL